jgi:acyl-CoA synthetase (AMP-forming)/AMP-acid ligase II
MRCHSGSAPHRYRGQPPLRDRNGFHTVGDLGWVDSEGYLYLADRAENVVVSGGVSVYPAEVEAALLLHPDIEDAMVVGVPDDELGHRVHALIQGRPDSGGVEIGPLRAWCQHHLSPAKLPRSLEMVPVVPRNAAGKIQRHKGEL